MIIARQSTARTVTVGPVLDASGVAVTDSVVGDFKISKNGGAPAALNGSATLTHRNTGHYSLALTASDLDTVGQAEIVIDDTTNACGMKEITVIEEAVYDSLFAASAAGYQVPIWSSASATVSLTNTTVATVTTLTNAPSDSSGVTTLLSRIGGAITITSGRVNADVTHIATAAVSTSTAQLGVNVVNFGGSAGTFSSGRPEVNTTHAAGTAWGSGAITAASIATGAIDADALAADAGTEIATAVWASGTRTLTSLSGLTVDTVTTLTNLPAITANWLTAAGTAADFGTEVATAVTTALGTGSGLTSLATQASVNTIDGIVDTIVVHTGEIGTNGDGLTLAGGDGSQFTAIPGLHIASGTIGSTGNDATHLHLTGLPFGDDELNSLLIIIYDNSANEFHSRWIEDWVNSTALATVATLPFTPQNATDNYYILSIRADVTGGSGLDAAGVRAAIGMASANLDTQLAAIDDAVDTEIGTLTTRLGTPSDLGSGASIAANLVDIESQTDDIGSAGAGLTALASAANLATLAGYVDTEVAAIKAKTDNLPSDPADASDIAASFASLNTKVDTIDDLLDTEVAALTTELAKVPKSDGTSTWNATALASLQSEATDALNAYDPPTKAEMDSAVDAIPTAAENATAVLAAGDVDGYSLEATLKLCLAALAGKLSGAATTTITIRAADDSKARITATVDADGNRSAITLDATG